MISRRSILVLLPAFAMVFGMVACTGSTEKRTVHVLGTWVDAEADDFKRVLDDFEKKHPSIQVEYEGTRDFDAVLAGRVQSGDEPDLALLPSLGQLTQYARDGTLVPLDDAAGAVDLQRVEKDYSPVWLQFGGVSDEDGRMRQYGLVVKGFRKSLIWYSRQRRLDQGWVKPDSWDKLLDVSRKIAAHTHTPPWCEGLRSSSASGWPGTDWIEDILLHQSGADTYRKWSRGELKWTDDRVLQAWRTWGEIIAEGKVRGGASGMLLTAFDDPEKPMFPKPGEAPGCYMQHSGSYFTVPYRNPDGRLTQDLDYFDFPTMGGKRAGATIEIGGDILAMFRRSPAAVELVNYLTGVDGQKIWAETGGTISPNANLKVIEGYPDEMMRNLARSVNGVTSMGDIVFDASDSMPVAMRTAFYQNVIKFVADPLRSNPQADQTRLCAILASLDKVQDDAYPAETRGLRNRRDTSTVCPPVDHAASPPPTPSG